MSQALGCSIIVPLYIYPEPSAWDPLFSLLSDFPDQPITLIINPNSGPYHHDLPKRYLPAIRQLRQSKQVTLLGYIATKWLAKPVDQVIQEIEAYARWSELYGDEVAMDGIFFDECTYLPTGLSEYTQYSDCVYAQSWHASSQQDEADAARVATKGKVVLNPGCVPDPGYYAIADTVVIIENSYKESVFQKERVKEHIAQLEAEYGQSIAEKIAVMVYSCESEAEAQDIIRFVRQYKCQGFFVTSVDGYTAFGTLFRNSFEYNEAIQEG